MSRRAVKRWERGAPGACFFFFVTAFSCLQAMSSCVRGRWQSDEDALLTWSVHMHGAHNWQVHATYVTRRNSKQCRERWSNHLAPDIDHSPWSPADVRRLCLLFREWGPAWSRMSTVFNGRTANSIKNTHIRVDTSRGHKRTKPTGKVERLAQMNDHSKGNVSHPGILPGDEKAPPLCVNSHDTSPLSDTVMVQFSSPSGLEFLAELPEPPEPPKWSPFIGGTLNDEDTAALDAVLDVGLQWTARLQQIVEGLDTLHNAHFT